MGMCIRHRLMRVLTVTHRSCAVHTLLTVWMRVLRSLTAHPPKLNANQPFHAQLNGVSRTATHTGPLLPHLFCPPHPIYASHSIRPHIKLIFPSAIPQSSSTSPFFSSSFPYNAILPRSQLLLLRRSLQLIHHLTSVHHGGWSHPPR